MIDHDISVRPRFNQDFNELSCLKIGVSDNSRRVPARDDALADPALLTLSLVKIALAIAKSASSREIPCLALLRGHFAAMPLV